MQPGLRIELRLRIRGDGLGQEVVVGGDSVGEHVGSREFGRDASLLSGAVQVN